MKVIDNEEEYLADLRWPELLPETLLQSAQSPVVPVVEAKNTSANEQTFVLTGWRGAGWRMVFLEEPTR